MERAIDWKLPIIATFTNERQSISSIHTPEQWLGRACHLAHLKLYPSYCFSQSLPHHSGNHFAAFCSYTFDYFRYPLFIFCGLAYFTSIMFSRSHVVPWNRLNSIPFFVYTTISLFVHTSVDVCVASMSWLFWMGLLWSGIVWTSFCDTSLHSWILFFYVCDKYSKVRFLDPLVILLLASWHLLLYTVCIILNFSQY